MTVAEQRRDAKTESPSSSERFSREAAAGYRRNVIENANVIVVGAGALGQFLMLCLALIGYPRVTCVDMDHFEESNATRSPFYRKGQAKAEAVTAGARAMCTATGNVLYRFATCMIQQLGDAAFTGPGRTVVLSAVDSQPARIWLAQRCRKLAVLLVEGGFYKERWNVSAFLNKDDSSPCWACGMEKIETARVFSCNIYAKQSISAGFIPATASGAMSLAAFQVGLMTQLLHGNHALADSTLAVDLHRATVLRMQRTTDPNCRIDHRIVAHDAIKIASDSTSTVRSLLLDVAELVDEPIVHLPATFVCVAPCIECHASCLVQRAEWAVSEPPRCYECGGTFERTHRVPEQHGMLSFETSESLFDTALGTLGIGPGLHLDVEGRSDQITVALSGEADEFLTTVGEEVIHDGVDRRTSRRA